MIVYLRAPPSVRTLHLMTRTNIRPTDSDPAEERRFALQIAADLGTDPRSVLKAMRGGAVRGLVGERIAQRIRELRGEARA